MLLCFQLSPLSFHLTTKKLNKVDAICSTYVDVRVRLQIIIVIQNRA